MQKVTLTEFGHATGAIQDKKDKRDFKYSEIAGAVTPYDWSVNYDVQTELGVVLPIKNQGQSLSCGGQAWSTYGNVLKVFFDKKLKDHSAKFIYSQSHAVGGGSGARDNSNVVITQGWASETVLTSYEKGQPPSEAFMEDTSGITDIVRLDAAHDKALSYATVATDIESIAQAIKANHGVIIGITGSNNGTWLTSAPTPPKSGDTLWQHWVYVGRTAVINGKKCIGIFNSWGNVGLSGWQWITEDYINTVISGQQCVWACWTLVFNPDRPNPNYQYFFNTDINFGDTGPEVVSLQTALQLNGQFPKGVPLTGNYQDITRQAVLDFQQRYVAPDGWYQQLLVWFNKGKHVSSLTRAKLNMLFAPLQ